MGIRRVQHASMSTVSVLTGCSYLCRFRFGSLFRMGLSPSSVSSPSEDELEAEFSARSWAISSSPPDSSSSSSCLGTGDCEGDGFSSLDSAWMPGIEVSCDEERNASPGGGSSSKLKCNAQISLQTTSNSAGSLQRRVSAAICFLKMSC